MNWFEELVEGRLLDLHTAFLARVVSVARDGRTASIQPLSLIKQRGREAKKQAVVVEVPILDQVDLERLRDGAVALCICADRDIAQTRQGAFALPALGHHQIQDAVIVGVLR